MSEKIYDLIVLGGGPGGYRAAERAGALGKSVLLIEKANLGGVCLNWGCIPTKSLLHSAKLYRHMLEGEAFGVIAPQVRFDLPAAMKWKGKVIETLHKGIAYQMKRFGVEVISGEGIVASGGPGGIAVEVNGSVYNGAKLILATGSSPFILPIDGIESPNVLTSTEILEVESIPASLVIIGGGVIGMEFASLFSSLGTVVHVVEMLDEIVPVLDGEISKALRKASKGITFYLGARVESVGENGVRFSKDGKSETIEGELILMSVGRRPNTTGLGLEAAGLDIGRTGVNVDEQMRTNLPDVYAVGDVTGKSLLAHSAYRMADVAVKNLYGTGDQMRYHAIPSVVYTIPEAASCGLTEAEATERGIAVRTATLPMKANGRFLAEFGLKEPGFCKVIVDKKSDVLLGVHMFGGGCSEHIFGAAAMIEAELRVKDIKDIVFPHPTVSEIFQDTLWELDH
ncbi:MAG: dihydrolipoyl dehydrogenase [Spirochaetales bacterium]|jgi:dihydrolipoamide dehydrogenase|nr:dihydrolipoyl dehydrogenase [Spirochaetales bacterium]